MIKVNIKHSLKKIIPNIKHDFGKCMCVGNDCTCKCKEKTLQTKNKLISIYKSEF